MKMRIVSLCLASFVFTLGIGVCPANPTGGTVVGGDGNGTISGSGTPVTIINQHGNRVIINWHDFSIGPGEITRFVQPSASSWALNRIISGNPSLIYGTLEANGHVLVINQNGIMVGAGGKIDTKGFVASTLDLRDSSFMKGGALTLSGNSTAGVRNEGSIQALGGDVFLIGNTVENSGTISAPQGTVGLAAGSTVRLVQAGNERVSVLAGNPNGAAANGVNNVGTISGASAELKAAGGNIYALAINNQGAIRANSVVSEGGHVYLRASGGNIQNSGTISANKADGSGGTVILDGGHNGANPSTVVNSGTIEARGDAAGSKGGNVEMVGDHVGLLAHAVVDVSGDSKGGTALIGGDTHGANPDVRNAGRTYVDTDAIIRADALSLGNGGKIVVWSDDITRYFGSLSARGGAQGGLGGFAEVSGHSLTYDGNVNLLGANGSAGMLLLDPHNITIQTGGADPLAGNSLFGDNIGGNVTFSPTAIITALNTANVTLQANNNISIKNSVDASGNASSHDLTLNAGNSISFDNAVQVTVKGSFTATINDVGAAPNPADRDVGAATFTMGTGSGINAPGGINIQAGTLAFNSGGPTTVAANTGDMSLGALSTRGANAANGVAGGNITVADNAAAGKNVTVFGTINASGSTATGNNNNGGNGGAVTVTASGALAVDAINANGGDGGGGSGNGGAGGAVGLTATAGSVTVNNSITTIGGQGSPGGVGGALTITAGTTLGVGGALTTSGGAGLANNNVGGNGGNIDLTAVSGISVNSPITANGGDHAGTGNGGSAGDVTLTGSSIALASGISSVKGLGTVGTSGTITLDATAGGANQTAGALTAAALLLQGAGAFTLNQSGNNVATLAGNPIGSVSYVDADALTIGTVGAVNGLSSGGNAISVSTVNGNLTVNNTAAANDVDAGAGAVTLTSGSSGNDNRLTVSSSATVHGAGGVTLVGDHMTLTGSTIDGGSSTVTLRPFENGTDISLGGSENPGVLALTSGELDTVTTTGTLKIGDANSGDITIDSSIAPANAAALSLQTGASISQGAGNTINIGSLALRAGTSITLNQNNNADTVAATAGGDIVYKDADSVTVGTVDGLTGVSAGANSVTLTAAGINNLLTIALGANVHGDAGVTLIGDQMDIQGTVTTAGTALLHGNTAARAITIGTDDTATTLGLVGTEVNNITAGVLKIGDSSSGAITITAPITVLNAPSLFLESQFQISQNAGATLTVSGLTTFKSDGAGVGGNITMNEANSFGSLSLLSANGLSVQVTEANDTALDTIAVNNGSLTINSAGAISQVSGKTITAGGLALFNSTGIGLSGNIALNNSGNNFGSLGVNSANGNSVSVSESSATVLDNIAVSIGSFTINSAGPISQAATKTITVGGLASFTSSGSGVGGNITLDNLGNNFGSLALDSANGSAVSVHEASATILDNVSVDTGTLAINSAGDISQVSGKTVFVGGNASFTAPAGNSVDLGNPGNTFNGSVNFLASGVGNLLNVTVFDTAALNLLALTIDGNLLATSGGAISQSGALNVGGLASFASTGSGANGNITLNDSGNNFGSLGLNSANGSAVSVTEAAGSGTTAGTLLDNVAVNNGTLTIHADGAINQVSGATINVEGLADFTSTGSGVDGRILLANGGNNFGSLGLHSANGDEIGVLEASSTALDNVNLGSASGILIIGSGGDLTQVAGKTITVAGNTLLGAPAGSSILVANSGNTFNGSVGFVATTTGNLLNVAVSDTIAFDLQALTLDGTLTVNAGGPITQSGTLNVAGLASFTDTGAGAGGNITLNDAGNNFGSLGLSSANGASVQVTEASATALDNVAVNNGDLSVTSGGDITQVGGKTIAVSGTATFTSVPGASVLLGNLGNAFSGPVGFVSSGIGNLLNIMVQNNSAFNIQGLNIDGNLNVTANGAITDSGALRVGGTTTLAAGSGNDITLDNANDFVGAVDIVSARNVTLNDINGLTVGGTLAGDLSTVSGGATAFNTLNVGGLLTVVANGTISDNGNVTVVGATTLNAGIGDITLNNADDFGGAVSIVNANNVTLVDVNSLTVGGNVAGSLSTTANGATALNALNVGANLTVSANGLISDNGNVTVGGTTTLAAGAANDITLNNADDFGGSVDIVSGHNVTLNDVNSLTLGNSTVSGNLNVTANGAIADSGNVTVAGSTTLAAGVGNNISFTHADDFGGPVSIVSGNNVFLRDVNAIDLGASAVSGGLTVVAGGDISDSGNLTVANGATFQTAGGSSIILDQSGNTFNGPVTFASTGGGNLNNVTVVDTTAFDITGLTVDGTFKVTSGGPVTQSGAVIAPNLAVTSAGDVTLNSANQVGTLAIDANGAVQFREANNQRLTIGTAGGVSGINSHDNNITISADDMDIVASVNSGTADTLLQPVSNGRNLHFGPTDVSGDLNLSQTELNHVTAHTLTVGNSSSGDIVGANSVTKPPSVDIFHIIGGTSILNVQSLAGQLASFLAGTSLPTPRLEVSSFGGAAIDLEKAAKMLPPGSIGTLYLQVPFVAVEEKKYKVEEVSKWTTGRIAASGTTAGPQTPR